MSDFSNQEIHCMLDGSRLENQSLKQQLIMLNNEHESLKRMYMRLLNKKDGALATGEKRIIENKNVTKLSRRTLAERIVAMGVKTIREAQKMDHVMLDALDAIEGMPNNKPVFDIKPNTPGDGRILRKACR